MAIKKTDILILGAGIGGYECFRTLSKLLKKNHSGKTITLIDQNNYFTFTPMLHEVASGSVQPSDCAIPIRQCIYNTPHEFWQATVQKINPSKKTVSTDRGKITYEYCVVALGSKTNFFNVKGAEKYADHVRNLRAAIHLHQKTIRALEDKILNDIHITIVGGGATGVELAGQFCHLAEHDVKLLYPEDKLRITIVDGADSLLTSAHKKVRDKIEKRLAKHKVKVIFNSPVKEVKKESVVLFNNKVIKSHITIWTAGFRNIAPDFLAENFCKNGQIEVNEFLQSKKNKSLYAIGDIAMVQNKKIGSKYPQLGEIAHHEGILVAKNIMNLIQRTKQKPFDYQLKGFLIPIGDWYAVAQLGNFVFTGRIAWWLRRLVYLMFIPGFIRKLRILIDWILHSLGFRYIIDLDLSNKNTNN